MEDDPNARLHLWKMTPMQDNLYGRRLRWMNTSMEDKLNSKRPEDASMVEGINVKRPLPTLPHWKMTSDQTSQAET